MPWPPWWYRAGKTSWTTASSTLPWMESLCRPCLPRPQPSRPESAGPGHQTLSCSMRRPWSPHSLAMRPASLSAIVDPHPACVGRTHAVLHPAHSLDARLDVRIADLAQGQAVAPVRGMHGQGEAAVEVGPGLEQALGMAGADAVFLPCSGMQVVHAAIEHLGRPALDFVAPQIGRASCRGRVEISVGAVSLKK